MGPIAPRLDSIVKRMLAERDTNKDGKLSKDEVGERMKENFDKLDANGDGATVLLVLRPEFRERVVAGLIVQIPAYARGWVCWWTVFRRSVLTWV